MGDCLNGRGICASHGSYNGIRMVLGLFLYRRCAFWMGQDCSISGKAPTMKLIIRHGALKRKRSRSLRFLDEPLMNANARMKPVYHGQ